MNQQYLIWDWNGTLFDDVSLCIESINYLLKTQKLPVLANKEAYQRVFRFPIIQYYKAIGFDFQQRSFEQLAIDYMEYYQPRSLSCSLYNGALDYLSCYKDKGYRQVLLSASKKEYLMKQVQQFPLQPYFHDILALDNIHAYSKAELACAYIEQQGLLPEQLIFIGDSVHDYEVAQAVKASCILIANGHEHRSRLDQTGAVVIDCIQDLNKVL